MISSDPGWMGSTGQTRDPDYRWIGLEGRIFAPDTPLLPSLVPIHSWYSQRRGDNFATTSPGWRGTAGDNRSPDYRWYRLEGYAFDRAVAGTIPLSHWYSGSLGDNHTTTHPSWTPGDSDGDIRSPDYVRGNIEGWILPSRDDDIARAEHVARFGFGERSVIGSRPLLVVLVEFADAPLKGTTESYRQRLFLDPAKNLPDYFRFMSNGRFTFRGVAVHRVSIDKKAVDALEGLDQALMDAVAAQGFNFARYAGRDGKLTKDELGIVHIVASYDNDGDGDLDFVGGGSNSVLDVDRVGDVVFEGVESARCNEDGDYKLVAHELLHQLGIDEHIYGPRRSLNFRATPMAASSNIGSSTAGPVGLDPMTAMLLGWVRPRPVPITAAGGVAEISALQAALDSNAQSPVLFYDPSRGTREFFVLQFRNPGLSPTQGGNYDAKAVSSGIGLWYVRRKPNGDLADVYLPAHFTAPTPGGHTFANYYIGPDGPGRGPFFMADDGIVEVFWGDGQDSGLRFRVEHFSTSSRAARFQWWNSRTGFLPRIDRLSQSSVRPGESIAVSGLFPLAAAPLEVVARRAGEESDELLLATQSRNSTIVTVSLPQTMATGSYLFEARSVPGDPASTGNAVMLEVVR